MDTKSIFGINGASDYHGMSLNGPGLSTTSNPTSTLPGSTFNASTGALNSQMLLLQNFWQSQLNGIEQGDMDFKTFQLPLARIKKVMKTDEEVKMISAEAPIIFAKACEIFILELTLRAWIQTEDNKRRTLQRSDVANAIAKNDTFDFLIDIVPRDDLKLGANGTRKDDLTSMFFRGAGAAPTSYLQDSMAMNFYPQGFMTAPGNSAAYQANLAMPPPFAATPDQQQFMLMQQHQQQQQQQQQQFLNQQQQQQQFQQQQLQHYLLSQQQQLQPANMAPMQQRVLQTNIALPFGASSNTTLPPITSPSTDAATQRSDERGDGSPAVEA